MTCSGYPLDGLDSVDKSGKSGKKKKKKSGKSILQSKKDNLFYSKTKQKVNRFSTLSQTSYIYT